MPLCLSPCQQFYDSLTFCAYLKQCIAAYVSNSEKIKKGFFKTSSKYTARNQDLQDPRILQSYSYSPPPTPTLSKHVRHMPRWTQVTGLLGVSAVALGAYGAHGLKSPEAFKEVGVNIVGLIGVSNIYTIYELTSYYIPSFV
jgi:hypothetical protein